MLATKLQIGKMDRQIIILSAAHSKDEYNQDTETWSNFATPWASVEQAVGNEAYQADQKTERQITTFTMRYLSGMSETMRVLYNDRLYDIKSIEYPDRDRSMVIKAMILDET